MHNEGDLVNARLTYLNSTNKNLGYLLENRFDWMGNYINRLEKGLEIGAGIGASKLILKNKQIDLSDLFENEWLDHKNINALNTGFPTHKYDFVIASNVIHHIARPSTCFREVARITKPGGLFLINEANTSFFSKLLLIVMRHEGFDDRANVFDPNYDCNDVDDPWSANCSIAKLLFDDHSVFHSNFPEWEVVHDSKQEFFVFLNSGGVTAKYFYIPLPRKILDMIKKIDTLLINLAPSVFALGRRIVLRKRVTRD